MHLHLVDPIVTRLKEKLPRRFEAKDLAGEGYLGLVRAAERYQPDMQVPFHLFASKRIHDAILDSIRRSQYRRGLTGGHGQDSASYREYRKGISGSCQVVEISGITREPHSNSDAESTAIRNQQKEHIQRALDTLNSLEFEVIRLRYFEQERSLRAVAEVMGLSKSTVSRLHRDALAKMRAYFETIERKAA